jgi:hypothetical protein
MALLLEKEEADIFREDNCEVWYQPLLTALGPLQRALRGAYETAPSVRSGLGQVGLPQLGLGGP